MTDLVGRVVFGTVIAMGQLQAGLLAAWLTDWLGIETFASTRSVSPPP